MVEIMIKHICKCGYIYNPEYGDITADINPGTSFEDLPKAWLCPFCGLDKENFSSVHKKVKPNFVSLR